MEIRKLYPHEYVQYEAICQMVFFEMERIDIHEKMKEPEKHGDDNPIWGAFDSKGRLCSAVMVIPEIMRINGHNTNVGIAGGVVTLQEARGKGAIDRIMERAFAAMRDEEDQIFSFVYPFSYSYYRRLGYETCCPRHRAIIPVDQFKQYPYPTRLERFEKGGDSTPFREVYKDFTRNRNFAIVRDDEAWEEILDRDPYRDLQFTFLHRDEGGKPDAYVLYDTKQNEEEGNTAEIKEFCWKTVQGFHHVLGFFGKLGSEYEKVSWNSGDLDVHTLFSESWELETEFESAGMARLTDICRPLTLLTQPAGSGSVSIGVTDKFLSGNSGVYEVQWEPGIKLCRARKTAALHTPDLECSQETLVQLITGYSTPREALYRQGTIIRSNRDSLTALFPKRALFMTEHY